MKRLLLLTFALLWAAPAWALTYQACDPVAIVGPQGRPIQDGAFVVTDANGSGVTVYLDPSGTTAVPAGNSGKVPAAPISILQFFADPGAYRVTVSGQGVSRQYWVVCTAPATSGTPGSSVVTLEFRANDMANTLTDSPALTSQATGSPSYYVFGGGAGTENFVMLDFVMPVTGTLTFTNGSIEWAPAAAGSGNVTWRLAWCTYDEGSSPCVPSFAGPEVVTVLAAAAGVSGITAKDAFTSDDWNVNWPLGKHVVIHANRHRAAGSNTFAGGARLYNLLFQFQR